MKTASSEVLNTSKADTSSLTVLAFDAAGNPIEVTLTPAGDERVPLELWVVDMETMEAKQVLSGYKMNTIFETYAWIDDDTIVAAVIPPDHPPPPAKPAAM